MVVPDVPSIGVLALYGIAGAFLLLVVGVPTAFLFRYIRLGTECRLLARRLRLEWPVFLGAVLVVGAWFGLLREFGSIPDTDWFLAGSAVFVLGVFSLSVAVANADWYRATDLPVSETGFVREGPVQISGEARPVDAPLTGPISDGPCLAYAVTVKDRRWLPNSHGSSRTQVPIAIDSDATRFTVDDGTGPVLVDPATADVRPAGPSPTVDRDVSVAVDGEESPPDHVSDSFDDLEIGPSTNDRRYREDHIQPGDAVHVVGSCRSVAHGYDRNRVITEAGDAPAFAATGGDAETVSGSVRRLVRGSAGIGCAFAASGAILTLWLSL
ncbi:hypothetical protein [Natrinema salsiterrestre]|uniref:RING-type E3 ubiquitin transferase n=1 Tax=Natrinema salsiterrestre TaxID=2950540 RepID=A0A9Q4L3C4_9EURY|nr:hypothetical protein [Natrinema salsiterrestre]MDF9745752.1 hypothetical protein [Natrinema salsiterrestre]